MFSAFHYNANRGDKRFRQMYKSGEKACAWSRDSNFEDSISRAKNNRNLLVEKFRQIQSQFSEDADDAQSSKSQDDESSQETFIASSKDTSTHKLTTSFEDLCLPSTLSPSTSSTSRPISMPQSSSGSARSKMVRASVSAFDSNSCEGFDYSSSFKGLNDNFTFNIENYNCSTEDIFDKSYKIDNATRERLHEIWNYEKDDYNWKFDDDELLLCPGCVQSYMKLNNASLICHTCTLQIDLSSSSISIKMIKEKLKEKLDLHKRTCKERIRYKFKDKKLFISCKHCNEEYYIS